MDGEKPPVIWKRPPPMKSPARIDREGGSRPPATGRSDGTATVRDAERKSGSLPGAITSDDPNDPNYEPAYVRKQRRGGGAGGN